MSAMDFMSGVANSRVGTGARSVGSWALNMHNRQDTIMGSMSRPLEYLGMNLHGIGTANEAYGFAGYRVGRGSGPAGSTGRVWIPDLDKKKAFKYGRWGTIDELMGASKAAGAAAGGGARGMMRQARMIGGRAVLPGLALIGGAMSFADKIKGGQGVIGAAASTAVQFGRDAMIARIAFPLLTNPVGAMVAATVGAGALYIHHRNKMADFRREVKRTEFVGDMSAFNTRAAVTMRQRSMQAIQRSSMNARSALGNEARWHHMPASYAGGIGPMGV